MDASVYQDPRKRMIPLADGEMAALEFGDPQRPVDVVFSHANGFNALTYRTILAPLAAGLRVLAIDLRGHGASRLPTQPVNRTSWRDFSDDLQQVLAYLNGPPVVLSGHSMGGTVSLMAAATLPERVKGLVLFDPVVMPRLFSIYAAAPWTSGRLWKSMPIAKKAAERRATFPSTADAFRAYLGRGAFKTWPEMMLADYVAGGFLPQADGSVTLACTPAWEASNFSAQNNGLWRAVRRLSCPVTIYRAERGSTCRIGDGRSFLGSLPKSRVMEVTGTSHFLPMENPDLVRSALLDAVEA